jgi:hypothetical protein
MRVRVTRQASEAFAFATFRKSRNPFREHPTIQALRVFSMPDEGRGLIRANALTTARLTAKVTAKQRVERVCGLRLHARGDVGVQVECDADRRVSEHLGNDLRVDPLIQKGSVALGYAGV